MCCNFHLNKCYITTGLTRLNIIMNFGFIKQHYLVTSLLVKKQMLLRYRRTKLGYLWTFLNPLLMMSVLSVVFSAILNVPFKEYALFFFSGMIVWNYINFSVVQTSNAIVDNEALIKKIYIPKQLFPISISIALLIDAIISFFPIFFIMIYLGVDFNISLLSLPLSYFIIFIFVSGLGFFVSTATVFFRDLGYIIPTILQAVFFLTPILYPKSRISSGLVETLFNLNPITYFISLVRTPLMQGQFCSMSVYAITITISLTTFCCGFLFFKLYEKKLVNYL